MDALQAGVYSILSTKQTTPVYDDVPKKAPMPCITLGSFTCKNTGSKSVDISDVSLQIHIWSDSPGKTEVNEIANDITQALTSWRLDLSASGFLVMGDYADVDFFEAFPEDPAGYHGVVTLVAKIQNKGVTT